MVKPLTSANQLRDVVARIVRDDHDIAPDLMLLIISIVDPRGDPVRRGLGDIVLKDLYVLTPEFEESFKTYLAA